MTSVSVIVCTRDREAELERAVRSLVTPTPSSGIGSIELIVVDDGALGASAVERVRGLAAAAAVPFEYARNPSPPPLSGLFSARIEGLRRATGDIILFLDDDVTVAPEYLAALVAGYARHPRAAGIGGVDQLDEPRSRMVRWLHRLFLFDSGAPGTLSLSGFGGSLRRWRDEDGDFPSEYLNGCNMSFRRTAVGDLGPVEWLRGYSLGEDLYLSYHARRRGPLIVAPALRVWHHRSPASREAPAEIARAQVVNMFRLLQLGRASRARLAGFFWTILWFVLKDAPRADWRARTRGYLRGIGDVLAARRRPKTLTRRELVDDLTRLVP